MIHGKAPAKRIGDFLPNRLLAHFKGRQVNHKAPKGHDAYKTSK